MSEWIISSSVLIVLVIALRHVLRGKINLRLQYALWLVVLVRLLMPVSIADSSFSIASFLQKNQTHQITDIFLWYGGETNPGGAGEFLPDSEQGNPQVGGENTGNLPGNVTTPIKPDAGATDKPVTDEPVKYPTIGGVSIAPSTDKLQNSGKARVSLGEILMVIWCAGMAVTAVMLLVSNLHFSKKLQKTRWLYERKTDALPVYESDAVETPCLFGLVRPAVYVTKEAVKDPKIMHHVLAHETTHYAHRDHIWAVLRCLCLVLHWYNPLVWWAADLSRRDAELACDEGTIERIGEAVRVEYGRTLIGLTCQGRGYLLSTATTMTGSVKGIKERIMLIANRPKMARYTVMLLIVLVMVMVGCTYCGVKETDVGAGKKEESTESVEHVSESVDESTTEAVETEASTEEPIEETTEAVSEELPSEEPTEAPTEAPTIEPGNLHTDDEVEVGEGIVQIIDTGKTVLVDLDGDGTKEKITVKVKMGVSEYEAFEMQINDTYYNSKAFNELLKYFENIERERFYLIDIDTSDKWMDVAFYERGPSGDPETTILRYLDGELVRMGSVRVGPPMIESVGNRELNIPGDGTIYGNVLDILLGSEFFPKTWKVEETSEGLPVLVEIIPEYYAIPPSHELAPKNTLRQEMPFFAEKREDSALITLPAGAEIEITRFYPEGGWIQITYEQGTKTVWLRRDENNLVFPLAIDESQLLGNITGRGFVD